jgi:hypothetical protein
MIGIYKIVSPSGRTYIGQSIDIEKRKIDYNQKGCLKNQPKIYQSILKYGWENHIHKIIEECTLEQLNERETYWKQIELDKVNNDWNKVLFCGLYDTGGGPKSKEWRQNISNSHPTKKPVEQYNIEGSKLNEYISMNEASRQTGIRVGDISACCNGKQKTVNGFKWMFKDIDLRPLPKERKIKVMSEDGKYNLSQKLKGNTFKKGKGKPIEQYDLNNNFIKEWSGGATEVEQELGFNHKAIQNNLKNRCKTTFGYIWKFKK